MKLGNNRWESAKFNSRLQVTELALGTADGDGSLWKLHYEYGELNTNGTVDTSKNTGNIAKQTLSFNGLTNPLVQTFKYDSLYRLTEAKETTNNNQTWKESFSYDRYGNRTGKEKFVGTTQLVNDNKTHPTIDPLTNRFNSGQNYTYDKNGNLVQDAEGRVFVFNGENKQRLVAANGQNVGEYLYDGEGKRVKKIVYDNGVVTEETVFVYSAGKLVAEYSTSAPQQNPTTKWTATDQLGSPRVITDSLGNVISRRDFLPFGEEAINNTNERPASLKYGTADGVRQKFTGYQKDDETGLDFAEARMYENRHGRFTAVDPLLASGKSADPQTFNRYVYCLNNPLIFTDPSGLQITQSREELEEAWVEYGGFWYPPGVNVPDILPPSGIKYQSTIMSYGNQKYRTYGPVLTYPVTGLQLPIPLNPSRNNDESSGTNSFEDFVINTREKISSVLLYGSKSIWNGVSDSAPDYGKVQFRIPLVIDVEFSIDREFRPYGGVGTPLFSYGNRADFNVLDSSKPKSFGIKAPSLTFGWFVNITNDQQEISDAMRGVNVSGQIPFIPVGIGGSKSLPSNSRESFLSTPTAVEIGTPGGGFGFSGSGEIPCEFCADLRNGIRNSRINPNNFGRPQQ